MTPKKARGRPPLPILHTEGQTLGFRVGAAVRGQYEALCHRHGVNRSKMFRALIGDAFSGRIDIDGALERERNSL